MNDVWPDGRMYWKDKRVLVTGGGGFVGSFVIDRLRAKTQLDAVILAGTELQLILREPAHNGIPFLNTTVIHCEAAVNEMFS